MGTCRLQQICNHIYVSEINTWHHWFRRSIRHKSWTSDESNKPQKYVLIGLLVKVTFDFRQWLGAKQAVQLMTWILLHVPALERLRWSWAWISSLPMGLFPSYLFWWQLMWWVTTDVAVSVCGRSGLWPFRFVAVSVCGRFGCGRFGLWPLWPVTSQLMQNKHQRVVNVQFFLNQRTPSSLGAASSCLVLTDLPCLTLSV